MIIFLCLFLLKFSALLDISYLLSAYLNSIITIFDKIKETNLNPIITKNGCMLFEESILSVECKKIYSHQMSQMNYENHEFHSMIKDKGSDHKMYIAEIIDIWVND